MTIWHDFSYQDDAYPPVYPAILHTFPNWDSRHMHILSFNIYSFLPRSIVAKFGALIISELIEF